MSIYNAGCFYFEDGVQVWRAHSLSLSLSFLQIALYTNVLNRKHTELVSMMERLEGGLEKLKSTAAQVDDLKEKLAAQEVR